MLTNYRKQKIKANFKHVKINNKDIKIEKLNNNNYKFSLKNRIVFITVYSKKNYMFFDYSNFKLTDNCKKIYNIYELIKLNNQIKKIIKKDINKC